MLVTIHSLPRAGAWPWIPDAGIGQQALSVRPWRRLPGEALASL